MGSRMLQHLCLARLAKPTDRSCNASETLISIAPVTMPQQAFLKHVMHVELITTSKSDLLGMLHTMTT